jgi:osmotically-inducible protein OsmY
MINGSHSDPQDVELESHISREIGGMGHHLHVQVKNGRVTLTGSTEDFQNKRQIDALVKQLAGEHQVSNQIRVISTGETFDNHR